MLFRWHPDNGLRAVILKQWPDLAKDKEMPNDPSKPKFYSNGQQVGDYSFDGPCTEWYPSGQVKKEFSCKNGMEDGLSRVYYENGKLMVEYEASKAEFNGVFKLFYPNGQLRSKCIIRYGAMSDGPRVEYDEKGHILLKGKMVSGKFEGLKDTLALKSNELDFCTQAERKSLKKAATLSQEEAKALHDAEQKARLKVSKAILKQRQTTK